MIRILDTDFTFRDLDEQGEPTLKALQKIVGGPIEVIPLNSAILTDGEPGQLVVNEEGKLIGLPVNQYATAFTGQTIVGRAVVLTNGNRLK